MGSEEQSNLEKNRITKIIDLIKRFFGVIIFLIIGILLFQVIEYIFIPKRFPYNKSYDAGKLTAYYAEENDSIEALICSTSHASKGILPMEMYEKYGIKSYNLSTSIQSIEATYYTLSEALKTQNPKVFIYDVSNLYMKGVEKNYWLYLIDEMRLGKNKIAFAKEYRKSAVNCSESTKELLFPLLRYHTRWKELDERDFTMLFSDKHYFGKGGQINSVITDAEVSVEQMNLIEAELMQDTEKSEYIYDSGAISNMQEEDIFYDVNIYEKNIEWLKKIKALCEENGIQFLAVKVPTIYLPQAYSSAWTAEKYRTTRSLCDEYGISYYDMLYEADVNIDWNNDTTDKGQHLNLRGAKKVSADLGRYLKEHYELSEEHSAQWDKDLESYQKVRKVAQLQLERDLTVYLEMLASQYKDNMIFISTAGDMTAGLKTDDVNALKVLGLHADFSNAFQKSYIAVIENGEVRYEALSNRQLSYRGTCDQSNKDYELFSSGWQTYSEASIRLSGSEYAQNDEGINIVVYDNKRDIVIDSVCFETGTEGDYAVKRNNSKTNSFEIAFERYITEVENQ